MISRGAPSAFRFEFARLWNLADGTTVAKTELKAKGSLVGFATGVILNVEPHAEIPVRMLW